MKKYLALLLSVTMLMSITSCANTEKSLFDDSDLVSDVNDSTNEDKTEKTTDNKENSKAEKTTAGKNNNDNQKKSEDDEKPVSVSHDTDFEAEGNDFKVVDNYLTDSPYGNKAIVIEYEWTNNTDIRTWFSSEYDAWIFQNGIECIGYDMSTESETQYSPTMPANPGETRRVRIAYTLKDDSAVYLFVRKSSWDGRGELYFKKKIDLGGGEGYIIPDNPGEMSIKLNNTYLTENYEGQKCIVAVFDFHNGGECAIQSLSVYSVTAYQGENELERSYINFDEADNVGNVKNILPGIDAKVSIPFALADNQSEVRLEIREIDNYGMRTYNGFDETIKIN